MEELNLDELPEIKGDTSTGDDIDLDSLPDMSWESGDGGTETGKRIWMLRCKISRPQISGSTKEANVAAQTQSVNLTCMARSEDDKVKTSAVSTDSAYANWFSEVVD